MALSGPGTQEESMDLTQTDYVMYDQYSGHCHYNVDQSFEDGTAN